MDLNALQEAASSGNIGIVPRLLAGADVNYPAAPRDGRTALQAAVQSQNRELIQLLVDQGADLNSQAAERWGLTALQAAAAASGGYLHIAEVLLEAGASVNARISNPHGKFTGNTALEAAAASGRIDMLKLLLNAGADITSGSGCFQLNVALDLATRLGDIPDQSVSADSFQGSGTGGNGTFQSFLSELIPVDSRYFVKNFH
ncbi:ankyrin [Hyaloscypha bicolor E]|uniref:Ankyrin n=1 Tax=Hyaloscypha bicolor E TaxID=1095630 RepID=A0A2J6SRM1_9HELO|nr:ankyrin [Hyaloscypha bicolor E]PMD53343.1 ankyrin [Hyaloscypha bicolor E]